MDIFEALYTTRAMRRMQARDVPDDLIPRILDAAIRAPSAGNFQNWRFIAIRDRETKEYLGALYREEVVKARQGPYRELEEALARGETSERLDAYERMMRSVQHLADRFAEVPVFILALVPCEDDKFWVTGGGSIYPAVWSIQLAARAYGIGTVPVTSLAFRQGEVFERLSVPQDEEWRLAACVALGYPTGRWGVPARKPAHKVTFAERWGGQPEWSVLEPLWPEDRG